jgi:hypothetical protein
MKKVNMVAVLSAYIRIWNTETCGTHFSKEEGKEGNNGGKVTKSRCIVFIYGNVTMKPSVQLLHTNMEMSQWNCLYNYYILI